MSSAQFNQMVEQDRLSQAATQLAKGPVEGEVWLDVDGCTVSIGECGDYKTSSDFLYDKFTGYVRARIQHPFEALAFDLDLDPEDLFNLLLDGADEQDIMDVLIEAYDGQKG